LSTGELYPTDTTPYRPDQPDADRALFPEYLTWQDTSEQIAAHVVGWLKDPAKRAALEAELEKLKSRVAHGGASHQAAGYIVEELYARASAPPRPHFAPSPEHFAAGPAPRSVRDMNHQGTRPASPAAKPGQPRC